MDTFPPLDRKIDPNLRSDENWLTYDAVVNFNYSPSSEDLLTGITCINNILINAAKKSFPPKKVIPKTRKIDNKKGKCGILRNARATKLSSENIAEN